MKGEQELFTAEPSPIFDITQKPVIAPLAKKTPKTYNNQVNYNVRKARESNI